MKKIKKYLSIYLSIFILLVSFFKPLSVYAHEGSGGAFGDDVFLMDTNTGKWTMVDDSSLPAYTNYFFYKYDDGKAWYCSVKDGLALIINKKIGVTFNVATFNAVSNAIITEFTNIAVGDAPYGVLKGTVNVGWALNDLSYCRLVNPTGNPTINIDSNVVNEVYEEVSDYINTNDVPDMFTYTPLKGNNWSSNINDNDLAITFKNIAIDESANSFIDSVSYSIRYLYNGLKSPYYQFTPSGTNIFYADSDSAYLALFQRFTSLYSSQKFDYTALIGYEGSNFTFNIRTYDTQSNVSYFSTDQVAWNQDTPSTSSVNKNTMTLCYKGSSESGSIMYSKDITVYRSYAICQSVVNNTYAPSIMKSTNYSNYNTSNDNSVTTNITQITNAQTTQNSMYYDQTQNYYNNQETTNNTENNYTYNTTENYTENTTIINNYYGDNSGDGDDNGGDDDDDDSIWDALLKALSGFLKKIGELLATILTGIIGICTDVLDAIASITESFSGITDFISSIFAFIPSEIVSVLTLGITLAVLISLIRLFRK